MLQNTLLIPTLIHGPQHCLPLLALRMTPPALQHLLQAFHTRGCLILLPSKGQWPWSGSLPPWINPVPLLPERTQLLSKEGSEFPVCQPREIPAASCKQGKESRNPGRRAELALAKPEEGISHATNFLTLPQECPARNNV